MNDEFKKKLLAKHTEEMTDHTSYCTLAKEARMHGMPKASGILEDIADEEHSHADLISHILSMEE